MYIPIKIGHKENRNGKFTPYAKEDWSKGVGRSPDQIGGH